MRGQVDLNGSAQALPETVKQIVHESFTLGIRCLGYSAFINEHRNVLPERVNDSTYYNSGSGILNHNGHGYVLVHFMESLGQIGSLWKDVPDFPARVLEVFVEINNLLNMIQPYTIVTVSPWIEGRLKQIGTHLLQNVFLGSLRPLYMTYAPVSARPVAELVQQPQHADQLEPEYNR